MGFLKPNDPDFIQVIPGVSKYDFEGLEVCIRNDFTPSELIL